MSSPPSSAAFWVVDGNHAFWDALTWADDLDFRTTAVTSLRAMVKACQSNVVSFGRAIDYLAIFGHGTAGYQSVGAGKHLEYTGTKSLWYAAIARPGRSHLLGTAESTITSLNGVLTEDATVLLAGCSVGAGSAGDGLLTTVSTILKGRAVMAFENEVYWWTGVMAGSLKTAKGSSVSSSYDVISLA